MTKNSRALDEARIRRVIDDRANERRTKNVEGFMAHYASEIVKFDLPPALRSPI